MGPCSFCDIVAGRERRVHFAFEDASLLAVMASAPIHPGQFVLLTKAHVASLAELGAEGAGHLFEIASRLVAAIRAAGIPCEGSELHLSEEMHSGLPHVAVQLLPRSAEDALWHVSIRSWNRVHGEVPELLWWEELAARRRPDLWLPRREADDEELARHAAAIRDAYQSAWGRAVSPGSELAPRS